MHKNKRSPPLRPDEKRVLKSKGMRKNSKEVIDKKAQARRAGAKPKALTEATRRNLRSSGGLYFSNPEFRLKHKGRK